MIASENPVNKYGVLVARISHKLQVILGEGGGARGALAQLPLQGAP